MLCRLVSVGILAGLVGTAAPVRSIDSPVLEASRTLIQSRYGSPSPNRAGSASQALKPLLAFTPPAVGPAKKRDSKDILNKLEEWRAAAVRHNPGIADPAAVEIGKWEKDDLDAVLDFVTELASKSNKTIRNTIIKAPFQRRLLLTQQELQKGDLNRLLKQGAILHTDISLLNLEIPSRSDTKEFLGASLDGRLFILPGRIHWDYARKLIDSVSPSPSEDTLARHWYVATTAHALSRRNLAYAEDNIKSALKVFPSDYRILFYAAVLHETWAAPLNQNTPIPPRGEFTYGSRKDELKKARKFYRKAVSENQGFAEGHLRFGRVLGQLGIHEQAIAELNIAKPLTEDPKLSYYIALFLGREFEMTSRMEDAREEYERAAMFYPAAQSPLLAQSLLAHSRNDSERALDKIEEVLALPYEERGRGDPFWTYDLSPLRDADRLIAEMYRMFGELER